MTTHSQHFQRRRAVALSIGRQRDPSFKSQRNIARTLVLLFRRYSRTVLAQYSQILRCQPVSSFSWVCVLVYRSY